MFKKLIDVNNRPEPFEFYTASDLWTHEQTSQKMLEYHLNDTIDAASRNPDFIEKSLNWIISKFGIGKLSKIADFGCGPGFYTSSFARSGADVTGIDFSENSLAYARNIALKNSYSIEYINKNYLEFETTKRFNLITMIMCDFCALSPEQRKAMLTKFHSMLEDDGAILLDVYSLKSFSDKTEVASYEFNQMNKFWSNNDYYCFTNVFKYEKEKVILEKYSIFEEHSERVVFNWLQYFSREMIQKEFEENGLKIDSFYSNVAGKPFSDESGEIAIIARKHSEA